MWVERTVIILNLFLTAFAIYKVAQVLALARQEREDLIQPKNCDENAIAPPRVRRVPFAKPSGKRSPRVNDDAAAWAKENDV